MPRPPGDVRERARGRTRVPARHLPWTAARVLARRDRVRCCRHVRRLRAVADLRGRDLLGRIRARALDRGRAARGAGGAADGRGGRLYGADTGLRARHPHHAAVGDHPVALLARGRRGPPGILAAARDRGRAVVAHDLCRADPGRIARVVYASEQARAVGSELIRSAHRSRGRRHRDGPASDLARGFGRRPAAGSASLAHARSRGRQSGGMAAANRNDLCGARGSHRAGGAGGRLAVAPPRARACDRAPRRSIRSRANSSTFLRSRRLSPARSRPCFWDGRGRSAALHRWSFCPASWWSWPPATPSSSTASAS